MPQQVLPLLAVSQAFFRNVCKSEYILNLVELAEVLRSLAQTMEPIDGQSRSFCCRIQNDRTIAGEYHF